MQAQAGRGQIKAKARTSVRNCVDLDDDELRRSILFEGE